ncbi:TRAP transporter small permease subunit [Halobacteriovorax sp. XZX-3]|uniref:TRAP transporter small permease n=1 Tax=unclassified Halobacteriovorax TaxID=2639665 RepID=UPI000CD17AAE|nr:TRAP transporter small permease subunit [Halobacteriovorax sp. DA5]POB12489.1 hypothetical protein C0Z22_15145 [Halobacteriovorax sp. DA5]
MIRKIEEVTDLVVGWLVVANVAVMLGLSVLAIIFRWFDISFSWVDPLVRHLVFALAFLGATLASGKSRHIAIEILPKFLESEGKHRSLFILNKITQVCIIVGTTWLFASGVQFYNVEKQFGNLTSLGLHSSVLVAIIPIGFALIFIRTILAFLNFKEDYEPHNN